MLTKVYTGKIVRKIGVIQQLQVQTASLKRGEQPKRYYDPAPLRVVPALRLTPRGVVGVAEGRLWEDVHHADHPQTKNRDLINGISLNFTGHYRHMQQRFGGHLAVGCAGENILVSADARFDEEMFAEGIWIETQNGQQVHLVEVIVAAPCAPFSEFALHCAERPPAELLKQALQFLDEGTRGFYCQYTGEPAVVQAGDAVFIA